MPAGDSGPHPRPGHQVHRQLRRGVRLDRCRDHPHSDPFASCERVRRAVRPHHPPGMPRSSARRLTTTSRIGARQVRPALQPGSSTPWPAPRTADPPLPPTPANRRWLRHPPGHPRRHHPRVRAGRLITDHATASTCASVANTTRARRSDREELRLANKWLLWVNYASPGLACLGIPSILLQPTVHRSFWTLQGVLEGPVNPNTVQLRSQ
jgi:hypothetical protein